MVLEAKQVKKEFIRSQKNSNIFCAVQETNLVLNEGEVTVLSGRSGSGKTTLLNMMAGLLTPTSGQILFKGQDLYQLEDGPLSSMRNRHFGIIPQGQTAISSMTILENVLLPYTLYGSTKEKDAAWQDVKAYAKELLDLTGISGLADVMPSELSGGELRRMAIARALLMHPEVIFADEPTGDLDDENTHIVLELLRGCAKDGKAVLLVTHDRDALEYGDRLCQMHEGVLTFNAENPLF